MKQIGMTIKYAVRNFLLLSLVAAPPAAIWGLSKPSSFFSFFFDYYENPVSGLNDILKYCFNLSIFKYAYPWLIFAVLCIIGVSLLVSTVEQHLRTGRFSYGNPLLKINGTILSVSSTLLLCALMTYLWQFLLSCVLLLAHYIMSGLGNTPNLATMIVAFLIIAVFLVVRIYLSMMLVIHLPTKLILGYPAKEAFAHSARLIDKRHFSLFIACLLPFGVKFILDFTLWLIPTAPEWVTAIVMGVQMLLAIVYFVSLSMISFFELSGFKRLDNKKRYYIGG